MKRIFALLMVLAFVLALGTVVSAEEVTEDAPTSESVVEESATETEKIDFEEYAEQFVGYIFSGSASSDELMDKIIAMGEQYQLSKEQGYTFEERINQLLTPDNIMTTIAAAFLTICGTAFFIFRRRQKIDTAKINADLVSWKKKYDSEAETNQKLCGYIEKQNKTIEEMKDMLIALTERSDISKQDMAHVERTAVAVAKMVKDVFLNSKTIDASGKKLLVHNYVETLGEAEPAKESDHE